MVAKKQLSELAYVLSILLLICFSCFMGTHASNRFFFCRHGKNNRISLQDGFRHIMQISLKSKPNYRISHLCCLWFTLCKSFYGKKNTNDRKKKSVCATVQRSLKPGNATVIHGPEPREQHWPCSYGGRDGLHSLVVVVGFVCLRGSTCLYHLH